MNTKFFLARFAILSMLAGGFGQNLAARDLLTKIDLSPFKNAAMQNDFPIKDIRLADDGSLVWILGQDFLWQWKLDGDQLAKIKIAEPQGIPCADDQEKILFDGHQLSVDGGCYLTLVDLAGKRKLTYRHPYYRSGRTLELYRTGDELVWIHSDGAINIELKSNKITPIWRGLNLHYRDVVSVDASKKNLWIARKSQLFRQSIERLDRDLELVYTNKSPIHQVTSKNNEIYAASSDTVLRFKASGELIQSIPVQQGRTISAVGINQTQDVYLFGDGLVEIYDLDKNEKAYDYLDERPDGTAAFKG